MDVNGIHQALFDRLVANVQGLKFSARSILNPAKLGTQQPAMGVVAVDGVAEQEIAAPARWVLHALVEFYVRAPTEKGSTPEEQLFALMEQTRVALQRQPDENTMPDNADSTTLGGRVWNARISDYAFHYGAGEGQVSASLAIEMLATE